jgi:hypothetical protein
MANFDEKLHKRWLKSDDHKQYRKAIEGFLAEWDERRKQFRVECATLSCGRRAA